MGDNTWKKTSEKGDNGDNDMNMDCIKPGGIPAVAHKKQPGRQKCN